MNRRELLGGGASLLTLAGCGGGSASAGGGAATSAGTPSVAAPVPAPTSASPTPTPPPVPTPPIDPLLWHIEGDSYMLTDVKWAIAADLGENYYGFAVGGSSFRAMHDRILAKPELRENPLIMWDGSPNEHVAGSIDLEMALLADIVAWKGKRQNWLILPSVLTAATPSQILAQGRAVADMRRLRDAIVDRYGALHVFDPLPLLQSLATTPLDAADVAAGYIPRSVTQDGLHPTSGTAAIVADALVRRYGPMAAVRDL